MKFKRWSGDGRDMGKVVPHICFVSMEMAKYINSIFLFGAAYNIK